NAGGGILGGTPSVNAANGVAKFTDLIVTTDGSGYTLVASSPGLSSATSAPFSVTAPAPTAMPVPPPPPPVPTFCNPRPNVAVPTVPVGPGQLQATIASQTLPATPANSLQRFAIAGIENAVVRLNGAPVGGGFSLVLPAGTTQLTLLVQRQ